MTSCGWHASSCEWMNNAMILWINGFMDFMDFMDLCSLSFEQFHDKNLCQFLVHLCLVVKYLYYRQAYGGPVICKSWNNTDVMDSDGFSCSSTLFIKMNRLMKYIFRMDIFGFEFSNVQRPSKISWKTVENLNYIIIILYNYYVINYSVLELYQMG